MYLKGLYLRNFYLLIVNIFEILGIIGILEEILVGRLIDKGGCEVLNIV